MKDEYTITLNIQQKVTEETDRFIYEAIEPWCEVSMKMVISKEILARALECFQKEHANEYAVLMEKIQPQNSATEFDAP